MKLKALFFLSIASIVVLSLSSCLKSTPYMDVSHTQPIIEFGISPANGSFGPFQYDSTGSSLETDVDTAVGLVIASPQVLTVSHTFTIAVDTMQIHEFDSAGAANTGFTFAVMPPGMYSIPNLSVTIAAGHRIGRIPIHLSLSQLPLNTAYALPLKIVNGDGLLISGATYPDNSGVFMWWFYRWY